MQHLEEGAIHAWLDGALSADEARQAEAHVAGCAECSGAVAEARGLIAASSMILSKLDGGLGTGAVGTRSAAVVPAPHDLAAARAAADSRQRQARRSWFAGPGLRAAAVVLVLAGGVAVVRNTTSLDEMARVVADASPDVIAARQADAMSGDGEAVAQDATAARTEQAPVAPPPPTVGPAPALPRPAQVVGGMTPAPRAGRAGIGDMRSVPQPAGPAMIGEAIGAMAGTGAMTGTGAVADGNAAPTATAAAAMESMADAGNRATSERRAGTGQGGVGERQDAEIRRERDFSAAAKAAAPPPPGSLTTAQSPSMAQRFSGPEPVQGLAAAASGFAVRDAADRCYALTLSPWSPEAATIPGAPATRIVLSGDTGTTGPSAGQRLVRPMPGAFAGSYDEAWYTEVSPSTLVLTWATGAEGIVMRLVRSGYALAGTARTFGAAGSVERTSSVRGEQVDCGDAR